MKLDYKMGLEKALEHSGISSNEMCKKLGITTSTWLNYTRGTCRLNVQQAVRIAEIAGTDIHQLIDWMRGEQ